MPLLKKKVFQKQSVPDFLRDEEEVFYCEITNEIFRDYEDFSERMFLCNSMVWTCSMTGKSNLTYQEALESEENAKKNLKEFPNELKLPVLFLANRTKRTSFAEMAEDVFLYVKDRYFIGENLEACFTSNKWKDCHILSVNAPSEDQIKKTKNGNTSESHFSPHPNLYKYEIEHLDAEDSDISEIMIVDFTQLRRKKVQFSRDKCKLFLKQYVEQDSRGTFAIRPSVLEKFGINKIKWDQISDGPLPDFECSKKYVKVVNGKKKEKQETLAKYLQRNDVATNVEKKNNLLEQMKKNEEEFRRKKQIKEEEKLALKQKMKEATVQASHYLRDWSKPKEDLDLEDQMKLPEPAPVKSKIPDIYFGDALMVMEFVENFSKFVRTKDFFSNGLTLDIMERALIEKEVAGPFTDIIQMLLTAIFNMQDEESKHYSTYVERTRVNLNYLPGINLKKATYFASMWSSKYQGVPLSRLPLYPLTVSEILRIHLLSSGVIINETGAKHRYNERGGYTSKDDPGLHLRLHHSHILKALATHNVVELSISDKLKILTCLVNQLLTYADIRDTIEERIENTRLARYDLRMAYAAEKKRGQEFIATKTKLQNELKEDPKALNDALETLVKSNERKHVENAKKIEKLQIASSKDQTVIGCDRAFRKYLRIKSIPGVFINWEDEFGSVCKDEVIKQYPKLRNSDRSKRLRHVTMMFMDEIRGNTENGVLKSPKKINGTLKTSVNTDDVSCDDLLMCSANPDSCIVHSTAVKRSRWQFFHVKDQINELINTLNKRGVREAELKNFLKSDTEMLSLVARTPTAQLNPDICVNEEEQRPVRTSNKKDRYEDANLGYPSDLSLEEVLRNALIDNILEMEEKICAGGLGSLGIKNREEWRDCLLNRKFDELDKTIVKSEQLLQVDIKDEGENSSRPNTPEVLPETEVKIYVDPGRFLGDNLDIETNGIDCDKDTHLPQSEEISKSIKCLAIALVQVAQAVDSKYLKMPLGHCDKKTHKINEKFDVIDNWEQSLLASTSFSQVFLHYGTLDSCILWSRSALLARCRICRRQKDSENMLLCDNCNLGHHLYCLKPKLTAVPKGDWFCDKCKKEREQEEKLLSPEPTPQKKRRIFVEEEEEEEEQADEDESGESADMEEEESSVDDMDEEDIEHDSSEMKVDLCKICGSGGELLTCEKCSVMYHKECCNPPMRRPPRGTWNCHSCKQDSYNEREQNEDSESDDEISHSRRPHRRDDTRNDLPLRNAALQELLHDVMKHEDAWPFLRPVVKNEVPDYYDVITKPMDFGTVKYKLNMGEYTEDSQLMEDVVLVFENCNTYNHIEDEVYKCGTRLLKYFSKKAKELCLKVPPELEEQEQKEPKSKKRRHK